MQFSATDIDDPDEPTPDEGHTEEDDHEEGDEVVPADALDRAPTGLSDDGS